MPILERTKILGGGGGPMIELTMTNDKLVDSITVYKTWWKLWALEEKMVGKPLPHKHHLLFIKLRIFNSSHPKKIFLLNFRHNYSIEGNSNFDLKYYVWRKTFELFQYDANLT